MGKILKNLILSVLGGLLLTFLVIVFVVCVIATAINQPGVLAIIVIVAVFLQAFLFIYDKLTQ